MTKKGSASTTPKVNASAASLSPESSQRLLPPMQPQHQGQSCLWNPHAGMKPSRLDDFASDGELELEDELPYGGTIKENDPMVNIMADLGDNGEWLPWNEWVKKDARITGKIVCFRAMIWRVLTHVKGNGKSIPMGPMLLQNRHVHSDARNMLRQ